MLPLKRRRRKKTIRLLPLKILTVNQPFYLYEYAGKSKMRLDDSKSLLKHYIQEQRLHKHDRPIDWKRSDGKTKKRMPNGMKSSS